MIAIWSTIGLEMVVITSKTVPMKSRKVPIWWKKPVFAMLGNSEEGLESLRRLMERIASRGCGFASICDEQCLRVGRKGRIVVGEIEGFIQKEASVNSLLSKGQSEQLLPSKTRKRNNKTAW
jgi:hypothetical protein